MDSPKKISQERPRLRHAQTKTLRGMFEVPEIETDQRIRAGIDRSFQDKLISRIAQLRSP